MVQMDLGALAATLIAALGVPSTIMGLFVWRLKKSVEARDKEQEARAKAQQDFLVLLVQGNQAAIALGEATAHAMQRGHTNGDMEAALKYATHIKHEQKEFLNKQGVHALMSE